MRRKKWQPHEIEYLKEHFGYERLIDIGKSLNRSSSSISKKAWELGLHNQFKAKFEITSIEAAYIAGFIDGDGSIRFTLKYNPDGTIRLAIPILELSNGNLSVLSWIKEKLSYGAYWKHTYAYGKKEQRYRNEVITHHHLSISGRRRLIPVLRALLPYLKAKKEQAQCLLDFFEIHRHGYPLTEKELKVIMRNRELIASRKAPHQERLKQLQTIYGSSK